MERGPTATKDIKSASNRQVDLATAVGAAASAKGDSNTLGVSASINVGGIISVGADINTNSVGVNADVKGNTVGVEAGITGGGIELERDDGRNEIPACIG